MSGAAANNPFEAGVGSTRREPPPPPGVVRAFVVQRGFRVLVLPTLLGLMVALTRQDLDLPAWSIAVVTLGAALLWLPTSLWMAWARFLRPRDDDQGVLLGSGEVLDRAAFRHLLAARAVEVGVLMVAMLGLATLFVVQFGVWGSPLLVFALLVNVWTGWMLRAQAASGRAAISLAEGRLDAALVAVRRAWPARLHRGTAAALDGIAALALVGQGRTDDALQRLERTRGWRASNNDVLHAMILAGRGGRPSDELLRETSATLSRSLALDQLRALWAIRAGDGAAALAALSPWDGARAWLPRRQREAVDLLWVGALVTAGEPGRARQRLARSGLATRDLSWVGGAFPALWRALVDLDQPQAFTRSPPERPEV